MNRRRSHRTGPFGPLLSLAGGESACVGHIPPNHEEALLLAERSVKLIERWVARGVAPESLTVMVLSHPGNAPVAVGPTSRRPNLIAFEAVRALRPEPGATWCLVLRDAAMPRAVLLVRDAPMAPGGVA